MKFQSPITAPSDILAALYGMYEAADRDRHKAMVESDKTKQAEMQAQCDQLIEAISVYEAQIVEAIKHGLRLLVERDYTTVLTLFEGLPSMSAARAVIAKMSDLQQQINSLAESVVLVSDRLEGLEKKLRPRGAA